ncbi:MAG: response regulator transcription factor [Pseudomonadota bacterium]
MAAERNALRAADLLRNEQDRERRGWDSHCIFHRNTYAPDCSQPKVSARHWLRAAEDGRLDAMYLENFEDTSRRPAPCDRRSRPIRRPAEDRHVLLIDRSAETRQLLATQLLLATEVDVFEADGPREGLTRAVREPFDLILLSHEIGSPGAPMLLRALRGQGIQCPVLIYGSSISDRDLVDAFDEGANDVFERSGSAAPLIARVRAHLRQAEGLESAVLAIGPYQLVPLKKIITGPGGDAIRLTGKEVDILRHLHRARGTMVDRQTLLEEIWGYNTRVNTHTLETHVYRLRRKLELEPADPRLIITERGGYRLAAFADTHALA